MPDKFVPVAAYATPLEADLAKNYLEAEGVPVFLSDDATVGWFWHLGNAVGGIKLLVPRDQLDRATAILAARPGEQPDAGQEPAVSGPEMVACARCGAPMDREMDYCPSCGAASDEAARAAPVAPAADQPAPGEEEPEEAPTPPGDELANRALRAAILGLIVCPPFLHLYSLWILLRLAFYQGEVSDTSIRRMLVALILDGVMVTVMVPFWLYMFRI